MTTIGEWRMAARVGGSICVPAGWHVDAQRLTSVGGCLCVHVGATLHAPLMDRVEGLITVHADARLDAPRMTTIGVKRPTRPEANALSSGSQVSPSFDLGFQDGKAGLSPVDATSKYLDGYVAGRRVLIDQYRKESIYVLSTHPQVSGGR